VSHGTLANEPFETEARRVERKKCVGGGEEGRKGSAVWCNSCRQLARYGCEARVQCPVWRALLKPSFSAQLHNETTPCPTRGVWPVTAFLAARVAPREQCTHG